MNSKTTSVRSFRAWAENQERLRYAEQLGLNASEILNEVLRDHLQGYLMKKKEKLREALTAPAP